MDSLKTNYTERIKPYLCVAGATVVGVYLVTPTVLPYLISLPFGTRAQAALLAGGYGILGANLCRKYNW